MKLLNQIVLMAMMAIMAACSNNEQAQRNGQSSDNRYTYDYVKKISVTQPKQACKYCVRQRNRR